MSKDVPVTTAEPVVVIDWIGGNCPVQAEGTINGKEFYFRARGEHWSLEIGGAARSGQAEWEHYEWFGRWPDAGWMTVDQATDFLHQAARRYVAGLPGGKLEDDPVRTAERRAKWDAILSGRERPS